MSAEFRGSERNLRKYMRKLFKRWKGKIYRSLESEDFIR